MSVMLHPVEVRASVQATQLLASGDRDVDAGESVDRAGWRQHERARAKLNRGAGLRLIPYRRRTSPGQKREPVAGVDNPPALVEKARDRPFRRKQLTAVV